jgi:hypothetical protein
MALGSAGHQYVKRDQNEEIKKCKHLHRHNKCPVSREVEDRDKILPGRE